MLEFLTKLLPKSEGTLKPTGQVTAVQEATVEIHAVLRKDGSVECWLTGTSQYATRKNGEPLTASYK